MSPHALFSSFFDVSNPIILDVFVLGMIRLQKYMFSIWEGKWTKRGQDCDMTWFLILNFCLGGCNNCDDLNFKIKLMFLKEAGVLVEEDSNENIFELQHHHLLRCLEKTTVRMIIRDCYLPNFFFFDPKTQNLQNCPGSGVRRHGSSIQRYYENIIYIIWEPPFYFYILLRNSAIQHPLAE